ncbi:unnamed protein product, partial [Durusdinium trenchii]
VFATCPDDNTDPEQEVILLGSFLDCDCPDPAAEFIPAGYVKREGEWVCGPGFAGTALKRCERPDTCLEEPEFLGCLPLQPCVIPEVDTCMFDLSDCINVMPSEICQISCVRVVGVIDFTVVHSSVCTSVQAFGHCSSPSPFHVHPG